MFLCPPSRADYRGMFLLKHRDIILSVFIVGLGDIAQLVEQMTFNHWVQGSSPCVPTKKTRGFPRDFCFYFLVSLESSSAVPNNCWKCIAAKASESIQSVMWPIILFIYFAATR